MQPTLEFNSIFVANPHIPDDYRDLSSQPAQITNNDGFILLRSAGSGTPVVLAHDFKLTDGSVLVTVPDVLTRDDYGITRKYFPCKFDDS